MMRGCILLALCLLAGCGGRAIDNTGESPDGQVATPRLDSGLATDPGGPDLHGEPAGWSCTDWAGQTLCTKAGGLPSESSDWICHLSKDGLWLCHGWSPDLPAGPGWSCEALYTDSEADKGTFYKCVEADGPEDKPPGDDLWICVKGTIYGGTRCERVDKTSIPQVGDSCQQGQRIWCDGLAFNAWGQVECDPLTGTWKVKNVNGKKMLDCDDFLPGGKLPLTHCACHHHFFNPACCERSDCIVPRGTSGQVCPESPGKLCHPCNPLNSKCVEPGAKCIVTNASETFCGQLCEPGSAPCPAGYSCMEVKLKVDTTKQCVPSDFSCYY
jgi:hypothetical protein